MAMSGLRRAILRASRFRGWTSQAATFHPRRWRNWIRRLFRTWKGKPTAHGPRSSTFFQNVLPRKRRGQVRTRRSVRTDGNAERICARSSGTNEETIARSRRPELVFSFARSAVMASRSLISISSCVGEAMAAVTSFNVGIPPCPRSTTSCSSCAERSRTRRASPATRWRFSSWITIGTPSRDMRKSNSIPSAFAAMARWNASTVFSLVFRSWRPRCAKRSMGWNIEDRIWNVDPLSFRPRSWTTSGGICFSSDPTSRSLDSVRLRSG